MIKPLLITSSIIIFIIFLGACAEKKEPEKRKPKREPETIAVLSALPTTVPSPADNPITADKVALGKFLFFDPILSGNKDVACASCHHPEFGFSENLEVSIGVNGRGLGSKRDFKQPNDIPFVKRNSQTVLNTAFNGLTNDGNVNPKEAPMFWDLRAKSLENQALEPIKAFEEMRGHAYPLDNALDKVVERLKENAEYKRLFAKAFSSENAVSKENLGKAIASYQRTLVANNSKFDKYMRGDKAAFSQNEEEGLMLFLKSGCAQCHKGPMLSDYQVHALGVPDNEKLTASDDGFEKKYTFRTPSLRNLRFTAPYMHSGKFQTLNNVLEFYEDLAGGQIRNTKVLPEQIDPLTKNLSVNFRDISLIVEFLNTLNDNKFDKTMPSKVPSGLKVGGNISE